MKKILGFVFILGGMIILSSNQKDKSLLLPKAQKRPPNILFAIADDQSFAHISALGQAVFQTPNFDKVAERGIMFTNAFVAAPQCSPRARTSRS